MKTTIRTIIRINSQDLPFTIDTYGMFNGDGFEDNEIEYYRDEYNLTETEIEAIEFDYNFGGIVSDLATQSVDLLKNNLIYHNETGGIVTAISEPENARSPQFYNYTTDSYDATWTIDVTKLERKVKNLKNNDGQTFQEYLLNSAWGLLDDRSDDNIVAMLDFYLPTVYNPEDYEMSMFEHENEIYCKNVTLTKESKKLIEAKELKQ